jgi:excisionase family DNA binding protein
MNVSDDAFERQLPRLLTVPQISMLSGFSRTTVQREIRAGRFPGAWRIGQSNSRWRIPREAVIAWLRGEAPPPNDGAA